MITTIKPNIRVTGDVLGHTSRVEVRVEDDRWVEIPVTSAEVSITPGDLTRVSFDLIRVETNTQSVRVSDSTLEALVEIVREHGYTVEEPA